MPHEQPVDRKAETEGDEPRVRVELIEEIGMRGRDDFIKAGGTEFAQIPCLNEHPLWIETLCNMVNGFEDSENIRR